MQPTSMSPTTFGASSALSTGLSASAVSAVQLPVALVMPQNFPLNLEQQQVTSILARVEKFDFATLPAQHFSQMSQGPTENLNRVLDGYLDRINKNENPQLFKLVDTLSEAIAKEKIGELAEQILSAKPSLKDRVLGMFSKKALQQGLDRAYEELGRAARNKSKSLSDVVVSMERKLQLELAKLAEELRNMDGIKGEYRKAFQAFGEEVVFLTSALAKAQAQAPALLAAADKDVLAQQEIHDKLQALESVTLAREAMMTRMPAEALIIRQLQNAGVSTLQELLVTMSDRFASIRMTLLGIHGANMVRNVQRLGEANAALDNQLQQARAKLMGTVVSTAANAPGNNRVEQANNLQKVIADTQALQVIVEASREANRLKFAEARATMSQARQDILALGQSIPSATFVA